MTNKHILPIDEEKQSKLAKRTRIPAEYDNLGIEKIVENMRASFTVGRKARG